jgi:hypothetical protein
MMAPQADLLWRVNNEYRKRLSQAEKFVSLLEGLLLMHNGGRYSSTLSALRHTRDQIHQLVEEHRSWRHTFYYESLESKRMVHGDREIMQALARFNRMRTRHEAQLSEMAQRLNAAPRPEPHHTRIPTGDLWSLTEYALNDLVGFNTDYANGFHA